MGLLSAQGAQDWHLAPSSLRQACRESNEYLTRYKSTTLQSVALGFGLKSTRELGCNTVVGCTVPTHVMELMERWNSLYKEEEEEEEEDDEESSKRRKEALRIQIENEEIVKMILGKTGLVK